MIFHSLDYIKRNKILLWLIIPAFILQMMVMVPSGSDICIGSKCGIHFWGVHSNDSMWHLEIESAAFRKFPFIVPTYAGTLLSGYNVLMDFVIYLISFLGIAPIFTLFKIIPILWFAAYTLVGIHLARALKNSKLFVGTTLFLLYFADHFGYLIQLYHHGSIFVGSQSFYLQSLTVLLNTQFALTLPIIMIQLIIIKKQNSSFKYALLMAIATFIAMGLKFYGGVVSLILAFFYLLDGVFQKQNIVLLAKKGGVIFLAAAASVFIFYNPLQATQSGSIFSLSPFATVHSVIEAPDMIYLPDMVNARYYLYEHGWSPRLVYIEMISTLLYFFFNFGTRVFGVIYIIGKIIVRKASRFEMYVLATIVGAYTLSIMLIQKGDWWNTVQFGYYGLFLANFLLALLIVDLISKLKTKGILISGIIILLTIPSTLRTIAGFTSLDTLYVPRNEVSALEFLKNQPDGVVFNSFQAPDGYPFLDYRYSGYVSAFSNKQLFLAHPGPLKIIGIDPSKRQKRIDENDCSIFDEVQYIYYVKGHDDNLLKICKEKISNNFIKKYDNLGVTILRKTKS